MGKPGKRLIGMGVGAGLAAVVGIAGMFLLRSKPEWRPVSLRPQLKGHPVSAPVGSDFRAAFSAVAAQFEGVVVADVGQHPYKLPRAWNEVSLGQAVSEISAGFDCHPVSRQRTLALQLRRRALLDQPTLELEEMRAVMSRLRRLISDADVAGRYADVQALHKRFAVHLTAAQKSALRKAEAPVGSLRPDQRRMLRRICRSVAYSGAERWKEAADCLGAWSQARVRGSATPKLIQLEVKFAGGRDWNGEQQVRLNHNSPRPQDDAPGTFGATRAAISDVPLRPIPEWPAPLNHSWPIRSGVRTLRELMLEARERSGFHVSFPPFAGDRRVWISSRGGSLGEALAALCDLWGWRLTADDRGVFLSPTEESAREDASDLDALLLETVPPTVRHLVDDPGVEQANHQRAAAVCTALQRLGSTDRGVAIHRLPTDVRTKLLSLLMVNSLEGWCRTIGNELRRHQLNADRAHLRLERSPFHGKESLYVIFDERKGRSAYRWSLDGLSAGVGEAPGSPGEARLAAQYRRVRATMDAHFKRPKWRRSLEAGL